MIPPRAGPGSESSVYPSPGAKDAPRTSPRVASPWPAAHRILVVEDNSDAREALALLLESWGHRVQQAADGLSGLETARADPPDIALIDVGLPGIDGYTLARELRHSPGCTAVRLIALSGYSRSQDRERGYESGFDTYLVKPVDPAHLRQALSEPQGGTSDSVLHRG